MRPSDYPEQEPLDGRMLEYDRTLWDQAKERPDLEWKYGPDPYQSVSLFRPEDHGGAVVVAIHGGGWTNGYKEYMHGLAAGFCHAGMSFASIGYRLAPAHVFPSQLEDCAAGLRSLCERLSAGQRGRVLLTGHSAGGHLAALLALQPSRWGDAGVRACLPLSGVYDLTATGGLSRRPRFLADESVLQAASPLRQACAQGVPMFLARAENDLPHLVMQQDRFEQHLREAGVRVESTVIGGLDHFTVLYEAPRAWTPLALDFVERLGL